MEHSGLFSSVSLLVQNTGEPIGKEMLFFSFFFFTGDISLPEATYNMEDFVF